MEIIKPSKSALKKTVKVINNRGVVICPTDTVYGFLADARSKGAVGKIYEIKKRPKSKPLPIFVKDMEMAESLALIDGKTAKILRKFWPGKYTFILKLKSKNSKRKSKILKLYGVSKKTIAIRIPKYKFLNDLLEAINRPLVQTSVNISFKKPLKNIKQIAAFFGRSQLVSLIIDGGNLKDSLPSKIIDISKDGLKRLR